MSIISKVVQKGSEIGYLRLLKQESDIRLKLFTYNRQYKGWLKKNRPVIEPLESTVKFSIILPTFNSHLEYLEAAITSIRNQVCEKWELCIADDNSDQDGIYDLIKKYAHDDKRIKYVFLKKHGHICKTSNEALNMATGEFVGFLDHDDILWPNALLEVVKVINQNPEIKIIYTDEDKIAENGNKHFEPFFKPDWSPEYIRSVNYINHFLVIDKKLADEVGGFREGTEGAQDWDLILRSTHKTNSIHHIPTILYSWRATESSSASRKGVTHNKQFAFEAQRKVLADDLKARKIKGEIIPGLFQGIWRIKYQVSNNPLVSIIIPTKDNFQVISRCLKSISQKTTYNNYEIILIDTGSTDKKVFELYQEYTNKLRVYSWKQPFNYSAVCNFGAAKAKGRYLLFLNNDTEVTTPDWMEEMLGYAQQKEIGAVGAKLLYPNGRIQHAGVTLGIRGGDIEKGVAGHMFKNYWDNADYKIMNPLIHAVRNFSAVTAACMIVDKNKFLDVNGFEERLAIAFNDVDFCLKLGQARYRIVYSPFAELLHHESLSVGKPEENTRDLNQFGNEIRLIQRKWGDTLQKDQFYNQNLKLSSENCYINEKSML